MAKYKNILSILISRISLFNRFIINSNFNKHYNKNKSKIVSSIFTLILILMFFSNITSSISVNRTIYVDDDGDADYNKIQDAINVANDGDTIFVYKGVYKENLYVDKSIKLISEDMNYTVIDGNEIDSVIKLLKNSISIECFTITNSKNSSNSAGIEILSDQNTIKNNKIIYNKGYGIYGEDLVSNDIISNYISHNYYDGICLCGSFK